MDIEQQNDFIDMQKDALIEQQSPILKNDLFDQLFIQEQENNSPLAQENYKDFNFKPSKKQYRGRDFRKILNTSSSNERLIPSELKYSSSRQHSQRGRQVFQTQNSMDQQSFRKSFKKRYEESFSVQNTIRDSSSSFSQKSQKSYVRILPSIYNQEEDIIIQKKVGCNCKRSRCLKLYCQCFQKQLFCNQNCNCHSCGNNSQNKSQHKQAVIEALARNAHGFEQDQKKQNPEQKSFSLGIQIEQVKKGCKCRKTHCIKKYCECFQSGSICGIFCKCEDCHNNDFNMQSRS